MKRDKQENNDGQSSDNIVLFSIDPPDDCEDCELPIQKIDEKYVCEEESINVVPLTGVPNGMDFLTYVNSVMRGKTIKRIAETKDGNRIRIEVDGGHLTVAAIVSHKKVVPLPFYRKHKVNS